MPRATLLLAALLLAPAVGAAPMPPAAPDPDVPAATAPIHVARPFVDERFSFTEGHRTRAVDVPEGWSRVVLVVASRPDGDPWDRLFGVSLGDVEVLRGTTPRADFTLRKDVTEHASLLPQGGSANVSLFLGTWVGALLASVSLEFYADEPTAALVAPPAEDALAVARWRYMSGGAVAGATVRFPDEAPSRATLLLTTSGHGPDGEFWWMRVPPKTATFRVLVDGQEVGRVVAMPYVYALVGFSNSLVVDTVVHPAMWWSYHRALDAAGVHTGVGEIPAYRADVPEDLLPLLAGERNVEVVQDTGGGTWVTSAAFLLDA